MTARTPIRFTSWFTGGMGLVVTHNGGLLIRSLERKPDGDFWFDGCVSWQEKKEAHMLSYIKLNPEKIKVTSTSDISFVNYIDGRFTETLFVEGLDALLPADVRKMKQDGTPALTKIVLNWVMNADKDPWVKQLFWVTPENRQAPKAVQDARIDWNLLSGVPDIKKEAQRLRGGALLYEAMRSADIFEGVKDSRAAYYFARELCMHPLTYDGTNCFMLDFASEWPNIKCSTIPVGTLDAGGLLEATPSLETDTNIGLYVEYNRPQLWGEWDAVDRIYETATGPGWFHDTLQDIERDKHLFKVHMDDFEGTLCVDRVTGDGGWGATLYDELGNQTTYATEGFETYDDALFMFRVHRPNAEIVEIERVEEPIHDSGEHDEIE